MMETAVYDELTAACTQPVRLEELVYGAAELAPGALPTRDRMEAERARPLAEKEGLERAQGRWIAAVLSEPRTGTHLLETMLRPTDRAMELLDQFVADGEVDLGE